MNRFIILFSLVFLSSCGVFRSVDKEKYSMNLKSNLKTDSVVRLDKSTVDRSRTIIQESIKGSFQSAPIVAEWYTSLHPDSLVNYQFFRTAQGVVEISSVINKSGTGLHQKAKFTPDPIDVDIDRTTLIENDIVVQENLDVGVSYEWDLGIKESEAKVKKEGKNAFWFVVLGIGVVFVAIWTARRIF